MRAGPSDWHRPDWKENGPRGGVGDSNGSDDFSEPAGWLWAPCEFPKVIVRSSYSPETWFDSQETRKPMRMKKKPRERRRNPSGSDGLIRSRMTLDGSLYTRKMIAGVASHSVVESRERRELEDGENSWKFGRSLSEK
ncbi:hypothetical protein CDL15_Pgr023564 [Punica granatum]|uniref:Uncharacterized protein n=1 Tax=Punica granatum TaxID=22663 RepID=A0A218W7Y6_PUNGR|nr:hypothetical protein CDL15_Pgr023564 [Punica granatum]